MFYRLWDACKRRPKICASVLVIGGIAHHLVLDDSIESIRHHEAVRARDHELYGIGGPAPPSRQQELSLYSTASLAFSATCAAAGLAIGVWGELRKPPAG